MMGLAPKNWSAFQHYKDRAPAWIKLHRGLLDDYEFHCLPVASKALAPCLWLLASEYEGGQITAPLKAIAFRLRMSEDELRTALKPLVDSGFFIDASGMLADCKRGACLEKEREEELEKRESIGRSPKATRPANGEFENFWEAYPRRKGANPKAPAQAKFEAAVKQGADPKRIIAAIKAGVGFDRDKIGTEYIPQAVKWFNDKRWQDYLDGTEADETRRAEADRKAAAAGYFWSDTEGRYVQRSPREASHETGIGPIVIPALKRA
jgi:hypothetical protein